MKVSSAQINLSEKELLQIMHEFVEVEGLTIETISINEFITIGGNYKRGIKVPFKVDIGIGRVVENILPCKILKVHIAKVGILRGVTKVALKAALNSIKDLGVNLDKDNILVDVNLLSKFIPFVYFKVNKIILLKGEAIIQAENIVYSADKEFEKFDINNGKLSGPKIANKIVDGYSKLRENILKKMPEKYKELAQYIMLIPDVLALFARLLRDKRVELKTKIIIGGTIAYFVSPANAVLNSIPIIGEIDDISIIFFALERIIKDVPKEVILENWQGEEDVIVKAREAVEYIVKLIGKDNMEAVLSFFTRFKKKKKKKTK